MRIECVRGDTFQFYTQLLDEATGLPLDLSAGGTVIDMKVRRTQGAATTVFSFSTADSTASVDDAPNGILLISQLASITNDWPVGAFLFDMQVVFPTGETVTVMAGEINVSRDITRTDP